KDLVTGARKVEHVRNLGKLSPEEQKAKADERAEAARRKAESLTQEVVERSAGPADYHGVIIPETPPAPAASPSPPSQPSTPPPPEREQTSESIPEPRTSTGNRETAVAGATQPRRLPYDDAFYCVHHLHQKMTPESFARGARVWMD